MLDVVEDEVAWQPTVIYNLENDFSGHLPGKTDGDMPKPPFMDDALLVITYY